MAGKAQANRAYGARARQALMKCQPVRPALAREAASSRPARENARLRLEKAIVINAAAYVAKAST